MESAAATGPARLLVAPRAETRWPRALRGGDATPALGRHRALVADRERAGELEAPILRVDLRRGGRVADRFLGGLDADALAPIAFDPPVLRLES